MRMLRHIYNVDWEDHITNDSIREEAKIEAIAIGMRRRRLQWYGHVRRRDREEDIRMVAEMRIQGKRKRGRPKKRWMDTVKDDMLRWGLSDEDVDDRIRWHSLIELGALQDRGHGGLGEIGDKYGIPTFEQIGNHMRELCTFYTFEHNS